MKNHRDDAIATNPGRPDDSRFAVRKARTLGKPGSAPPQIPRPDETTFTARKPAADITNAAKAARHRMVSLGVSKQWVEGAGRDAPIREFEDLFDYDTGTHYRRYRDNPNLLVPMGRTVEPDRVRTLGTFDTSVSSSNRVSSTPNTSSVANEPPDW